MSGKKSHCKFSFRRCKNIRFGGCRGWRLGYGFSGCGSSSGNRYTHIRISCGELDGCTIKCQGEYKSNVRDSWKRTVAGDKVRLPSEKYPLGSATGYNDLRPGFNIERNKNLGRTNQGPLMVRSFPTRKSFRWKKVRQVLLPWGGLTAYL